MYHNGSKQTHMVTVYMDSRHLMVVTDITSGSPQKLTYDVNIIDSLKAPNLTGGYAGGGYYTNPGSAAEYVCLLTDPDFAKTSGTDGGRMYGAEYESNFFGKDDEDVPCAVCRKTFNFNPYGSW
ncbi:Hypothetical predicted protein [Mytilus galloprovincialis]|uniref:Uncharacterized protein n=1 Tax=Mytilus galloprovincialis TaxID=29158 RepID=A0A8B6HAP2_MYTGA|nr:Hypothetical predicted protein [Mytilus galloprovincialis]